MKTTLNTAAKARKPRAFGTKERKGAAKKRGVQAAKEWCQSASFQEQIRIAGLDFEYGESLDASVFDGLKVPKSKDIDFSWGFYKQVKSRVYHAMYAAGSRPMARQ